MDPLGEKYYSWSGYNYVMDSPLLLVDPDGRYVLPSEKSKKYPKLDNYLKYGMASLLSQEEIRSGLKVIGNFSDGQIEELATYGEGLFIELKQLDNDKIDHPQGMEVNGYTPEVWGGRIQIDETLAFQLEQATTPEEEQAALLAIVSTILHETVHHGGGMSNPENFSSGKFSERIDPYYGESTYFYNGVEVGDDGERGNAFGNAIWYNGGMDLNFGWDRKQGEKGLFDQINLVRRIKNQGREYVLPNLRF